MDKKDIDRIRSESLRWRILDALEAARPVGLSEIVLTRALHDPQFSPVTRETMRRELDWLRDRNLIEISRSDGDNWGLDITPRGQDLVAGIGESVPGVKPPPEY